MNEIPTEFKKYQFAAQYKNLEAADPERTMWTITPRMWALEVTAVVRIDAVSRTDLLLFSKIKAK